MTIQNLKQFSQDAQRFLDINKWGSFLLKWAECLEAYGTPWDFVSSTKYRRTKVEFLKEKFPVTYVLSPNNAKRKELMAKGKPYQPLKLAKDYNVRLSLEDCFLCQNIAQGIDAKSNSKVKNNVMYGDETHLIFPNKYPSQFGHSLAILVNHDDNSTRVTPTIDSVDKTTIYLPEEGKTRGNIITKEYLQSIINICDSLNLVASKNHTLDGMSIPGHDHSHLFPEDLPPF